MRRRSHIRPELWRRWLAPGALTVILAVVAGLAGLERALDVAATAGAFTLGTRLATLDATVAAWRRRRLARRLRGERDAWDGLLERMRQARGARRSG